MVNRGHCITLHFKILSRKQWAKITMKYSNMSHSNDCVSITYLEQ